MPYAVCTGRCWSHSRGRKKSPAWPSASSPSSPICRIFSCPSSTAPSLSTIPACPATKYISATSSPADWAARQSLFTSKTCPNEKRCSNENHIDEIPCGRRAAALYRRHVLDFRHPENRFRHRGHGRNLRLHISPQGGSLRHG